MNIYQKIVEVRKSIEGFSKDKKSFGYQYVSGNQILRAVKEKMDELGLLLMPQIDYDTLQWQKHEYVTSKGKEALDFIIQAKMIYTWINAENPEEKIEIPWVCIGQQQDDISKAMGTAMTYNERYFLLKFFGLPTDEDDADNRDASKEGNVSRSKNRGAGNGPMKPIITEKQKAEIIDLALKCRVSESKLNEDVQRTFGCSLSQITQDQARNVYDGYRAAYENMKEKIMNENKI